MSQYRLSSTAESQLDDIWLYIARDNGNQEIATEVVEGIVAHFPLIAKHPLIGRKRDGDLAAGVRSLQAGLYRITYTQVDEDTVEILHILHGSRDIEAFFR